MAELLDLGFANAPKVASFSPLSSIDLRPNLINQMGKNSLLNISEIPVSRPSFFISEIENSEEVSNKELEKILDNVEETLVKKLEEDLLQSKMFQMKNIL